MKFWPSYRRLAALLLNLTGLCAAAQSTAVFESYGFRAGLVLAYGTHFQRLGLNFNFYYCYKSVQLNSELRLYRNFRNLGPPQPYNELVLSQGILFAYGKNTDILNPFVNPVSNQSGLDHSIAYAYNAYFNKMGTTQQSGTFSFQFRSFYLMTENDLFARPQLDRFRTGAILMMWQYKDLHQFALNCSMWTGQMGYRQASPDSSVFRHCYMDSVGGKYCSYSHGLLSAQFKTMLPYQQSLQANAGLDAEQVRNAVQNRFFHDMVFLPARFRSDKNCHIPMLDQSGQAYLGNKSQHVRPARPYLNAYTNPSLFY
ncbi:MAG TPA: polymorphic toxin type 23 domain-containing protein [Bacteroidia bacterium]|nr:polymorphic toxin type 23 domain-containing protein [Bacteroidia bacterium]